MDEAVALCAAGLGGVLVEFAHGRVEVRASFRGLKRVLQGSICGLDW